MPSSTLKPTVSPSQPRTEAGLQWEEEATHRDLETHSPAQSRVPGRTFVFGNGGAVASCSVSHTRRDVMGATNAYSAPT